MKQLLDKIKEYETIIILRHSNPDLDALGSQIGLKETLQANFPEKKIYAIGDMNKFTFLADMDEVDYDVFTNALCIICDVATSKMMKEYRYLNAKEIFVIDHHKNPIYLDVENVVCQKPIYSIIKTNYVACCEIITEFIKDNNLILPQHAATALYGGLVTDSGRFQYGSNLAHTFLMASFLMEKGADASYIYKNLYVESLESKLMKNYFQNKMQLTKNNVAYMFNDLDVYERFNVDTFTISRGMVNLMAGIDKVHIWANFTVDKETNKVICEFRSREIVIVDIAKKYGGGGHEFACGATIDNFEVANEILNEFDKLVEDFLNV